MLLVNRFLEPVAEVTEILDETQTAVSGWRRVLDLLDTPIDIVEPDPGVVLPPGPPSIAVEHVSFSYRPRPGSNETPEPALRDVSVVIDPGTSVAVVGATGSGKTTFAKLLTRLADPTDGRILVSGVDLRDVERTSLRSSLVMVPQDAFLFDTTIAENVRFGRPGADADAVRLAFVELGLEAWVDSLADGLDDAVGERGEHLSVGERQLVALARAYVANPVCLILDEATSAVDAAIEARLARAVESLARGRTAVTIAHRLSTAERSDVVLVFDQGRLVERGSHHELLAHGGVYRAAPRQLARRDRQPRRRVLARLHHRHDAGISVDAHRRTVRDRARRVDGVHHRWDRELASDDRWVAQRAASVTYERAEGREHHRPDR